MMSKIEDNYSFKNIREQIQGFELIISLYKFTKFFGYKNPDFDNAIQEISNFKSDFDKISKSADLFNNYFSEKGWIAYESMSSSLLDKCLTLAMENNIEEAEREMIEYYKKEDAKRLIVSLKNIKEFKPRYDLIIKAYDDFKENRYYAMIPIILMMIDGVVDDVLKDNKGFFSEGADLTAWDSLAGHESGLTQLAKIFSKGRYKTNTDKILIPYRNGILHGKDLNYANETVAAKTWAALFAVKDWVEVVKSGKNFTQKTKKTFSLNEIISELRCLVKDIQVHKTNKAIIDKKLKEWKPRNIISSNINPSNFDVLSPEHELVLFIENFKLKNYGKIAQQLESFTKKKETVSKVSGQVRNKLKDVELKSYSIEKISDFSPAISVIEVRLNVICDNKTEISKLIKFTWICLFSDGSVAIRNDNNSRWYLIDNNLLDIYNIENLNN